MRYTKTLLLQNLKSTALGFLVVACFARWSPAQAEVYLYVTVPVDDEVVVIDTATNTIVARVAVGDAPQEVAVHPDGTFVYSTDSGDSAVSVIDTATNTVVDTVPISTSKLVGVAVHPDGSVIYVSAKEDDTVFVIDADTNQVLNTISVGDNPMVIAVHPNGSEFYVANSHSNNVSVVDTTTNTTLNNVPAADESHAVAVTPAGTDVYVAHRNGRKVLKIDTATYSVTEVFNGNEQRRVAVHPDGTFVYATLNLDDKLLVIDAATDMEVTRIPVGDNPYSVAVHPDGTFIYVSNTNSGTVSVIDADTNIVVYTIPIKNGVIGQAGTTVGAINVADRLSCSGFLSPLDGGPVTVKKNRVLPFKAYLLNEQLQYIDDLGISSPPVIQVIFDDGVNPAEDVTADSLPAGAGTEGNKFEFLDSKWHFNLKTKNYTAAGTYTVTMESGDDSEYQSDPECAATFVIN